MLGAMRLALEGGAADSHDVPSGICTAMAIMVDCPLLKRLEGAHARTLLSQFHVKGGPQEHRKPPYRSSLLFTPSVSI